MRDRRALIVLVLFVALISGGVVMRAGASPFDGPFDGPLDGKEMIDPVSVPTTSPVVSDDFNSAVRRITDIENELFANPNPSRVAEIMLTECSCHDDTRGRLENFVDNGWRIDGANIAVESTSVYQIRSDHLEGVVLFTVTGAPTVDREGKVVQSPTKGASVPLVYVLKKGQDGVWRIFDRHLPEGFGD